MEHAEYMQQPESNTHSINTHSHTCCNSIAEFAENEEKGKARFKGSSYRSGTEHCADEPV